jgi:cell wall-associated NlpC family hydrolase
MNAEHDASRNRIVEEARSWIGTPFHDCAGVKHHGVDCVHFLEGVFKACGFALDFSMPEYPPQWALHRDEPKFLLGIARYAHRVDRPSPGDVAMFKYGRHAAHGAIVIGIDRIVHASNKAGCVMEDVLRPYLARLDSYWSVFS